jgi:hypothetical protein
MPPDLLHADMSTPGTTFDSSAKTTSFASPHAQVILGDPTGCESYEYDATSLLHRLVRERRCLRRRVALLALS